MGGTKMSIASVLALTLASAAVADPPESNHSGHHHGPACERPLCSRWHYWTPTLYRLVDAWHAPRPEGPPGATSAVIVNYPCRDVSPASYYRGTGLPYDPTRPVVLAPAGR